MAQKTRVQLKALFSRFTEAAEYSPATADAFADLIDSLQNLLDDGEGGGGELGYLVYTALLTQEMVSTTEGLFVIGKTYVITSLEAGDNFSNVGYEEEGVPFVASGTTPTDWTNTTTVKNLTDSAPVPTILQNTIGEIVWSYFTEGHYKGILAAAFPLGKTWFGNVSNLAGLQVTIENQEDGEPSNTVTLKTYVEGTLTDEQLYFYSIEIRVYP